MSMRLGYDLKIEQSQKLVMTPELIQAIQILQFNTQELDSYVQDQLLANPVLEQTGGDPEGSADTGNGAGSEGDFSTDPLSSRDKASDDKTDDFDWKEYIKDRQYDDISYRHLEDRTGEDRENAYEQYVCSDTTLPEHLMFQLQFATDSRRCLRAGSYIIESLDGNGYMTSSIGEIAEAVGMPEDRIRETVDMIQGFDPPGVCAEDLADCLKIQLRQMGCFSPAFEKVIDLHLQDLADGRFALIARNTGISPQKVREMNDIIKTLEPKPGRLFASRTDTRYIVPDVFVEKSGDDYVVTVNENSTPRLMISSYYSRLMRKTENDEKLSRYLSERVNSALWLIRSIEQRKQTIYNVVSAVVKFQREFFDKGVKYLKTLTLRNVAEYLGIHESTVSRTISGKYIQCPAGVFEIKYFFSAGVPDRYGEGISSRSIKEFIKEIVGGEDPGSPYSDKAISEILEKKGMRISRRTVAKYRDELNILSSSKRKRY